MAINYASKYADKIDERFSREAMSTPAVNNDYDFVGVKTVNVYSVPTAPMNDYTKNGSSRYGTPSELENSVQEMTLTKDRSFTFSIDRGNYSDTQMSNAAGQALQRQIREVVVPEIDKYRFEKICSNAGNTATAAVTKANAYDAFLDGTTALVDNKVPTAGAVAYVSSAFYKLIKQDDSFIKRGDISQDMLIKGQVGMIDGIPVVVLPASYMPDGVLFFNVVSDTAEGTTYGDAYSLRGTVEIAPTDAGGSDVFDADNGAYETSSYLENLGHDITNADIPPEVDALWRGLERKNGMVEVGNDTKTVYFGVAWRILKSDGTYRYVRYYKGSYSFASNIGGKTKASSGAPEKQTAKATYTAVQRDFDNNYYAYFDEADLPEGVTKTELEEKWFTDMNYYPEAASVTPTASTTSKKAAETK